MVDAGLASKQAWHLCNYGTCTAAPMPCIVSLQAGPQCLISAVCSHDAPSSLKHIHQPWLLVSRPSYAPAAVAAAGRCWQSTAGGGESGCCGGCTAALLVWQCPPAWWPAGLAYAASLLTSHGRYLHADMQATLALADVHGLRVCVQPQVQSSAAACVAC